MPQRRWRRTPLQTGWAATWWERWLRDANGDLWVATLAGLSRLHGGKIQNFTTANGLSSNVVTALLPRADGTLLIGTEGPRLGCCGMGSGFPRADAERLEQA